MQFESQHYPGETLTVEKLYGKKMFSMKISNSDSTVMGKHDSYDGAKLMLAHISREASVLTIKTKEIQW